MKSFYAALLMPFVWLGTAAAQDQPDPWRNYKNERYGFSLVIPSRELAVEKRSGDGDGLLFSSKDGEARLLVGTLPNTEKQTPNSYQDYIAKQSYADYAITYRRSGETWFVLSGEGNDKIFYEKVMFSCGGELISSFAMIYPAERRKAFDPIVEKVEDSFRPATKCGDQAAAKTTTPPAAKTRTVRVAPKLARPAGPRSALADRIARERGTDVIVILRRTGPPYDRQIVRGYVSR
jgi:pyruvate/2-oxoglutarate dehydrogenase complex dihydrolipoamide acyltransferase (E2) component